MFWVDCELVMRITRRHRMPTSHRPAPATSNDGTQNHYRGILANIYINERGWHGGGRAITLRSPTFVDRSSLLRQ